MITKSILIGDSPAEIAMNIALYASALVTGGATLALRVGMGAAKTVKLAKKGNEIVVAMDTAVDMGTTAKDLTQAIKNKDWKAVGIILAEMAVETAIGAGDLVATNKIDDTKTETDTPSVKEGDDTQTETDKDDDTQTETDKDDNNRTRDQEDDVSITSEQIENLAESIGIKPKYLRKFEEFTGKDRSELMQLDEAEFNKLLEDWNKNVYLQQPSGEPMLRMRGGTRTQNNQGRNNDVAPRTPRRQNSNEGINPNQDRNNDVAPRTPRRQNSNEGINPNQDRNNDAAPRTPRRQNSNEGINPNRGSENKKTVRFDDSKNNTIEYGREEIVLDNGKKRLSKERMKPTKPRKSQTKDDSQRIEKIAREYNIPKRDLEQIIGDDKLLENSRAFKDMLKDMKLDDPKKLDAFLKEEEINIYKFVDMYTGSKKEFQNLQNAVDDFLDFYVG